MYWTGCRFSHEQRHLTHPRHDLLGSKVVGLSDRSLVWRNVLPHRDVPWMKDHSLGGSTIFPTAGHLSLAIEAVRQICEDKAFELAGITLRDVDIKTALVIPDNDDGIEIQVRVNHTKSDKVTPGYTFAVESLSNDMWTLHYDGTISPVPASLDVVKDLSHPVDRRQLT